MSLTGTDALALPELHELVNARGDRVQLCSFGARVASIQLELKGGRRQVTLGYPRLADYLDDRYFVGATIGRCANRIRGARLPVGHRCFRLTANDGANQLHGGPNGFHRRYWFVGGGATARHVEYCLQSPDGDAGYPGNLRASVRLSWNDERELSIRYAASTDLPTHVNLTNHTYFNLDGAGFDVLGHRVRIQADSITDVGPELLPTGALLPVEGTALDLRRSTALATLVGSGDRRVALAGGADFNYVLTGEEPAAAVTGSRGDLELEVHTTCPGLQLYSGQNLGAPFAPFAAFCLETQYFPDSPNQPRFPPTLLEPGRLYSESTTYRFFEP
ncbi:MAG TPA: aldose epimerase family protein [Woeseiaceae bacterium]|nr:aldose epimerase family protein [Woeseiaceae bacterium]